MTNLENAERLRTYYLTHDRRNNIVNVCRARRKWNGCDYCDIYSGSGCECWKQDTKHECVYCEVIRWD